MRDERGRDESDATAMARVDGSALDPTRETSAEELEAQIESLRAELGELVQELDRRRHEVLDVRLQLRRHAGAVAVGVGLVAVFVAGRLALRRRRNPVLSRGQNLARVLAVLSKENPSDVHGALRRQPGSPVLVGLAGLAAAVIVRRALPHTP